MEKIRLGLSNLEVSVVGLGCMRMASKNITEAVAVVQAALDAGINFFDHADIYGKGQSEIIFGHAMRELKLDRESIIIQSKCGINQTEGTFDYSKDYILESVDGILERLQTDYLDILILHRPDVLVEPKEVAEAFDILKANGKVRHFGVSNHSGIMIDLLKKDLNVDLITNQIQLSIMHTPVFDYGLNFNNRSSLGTDHSAGIVEYSRLNDMTLQAWSPFYHGYFEAVFVDNENYPLINEAMQIVADKYGVSKEAVAVAWINRHPAKIQTIVGSMTPSRIERIGKVSDFEMTRKEWYDLYKAAGNKLP